VGGRGQDEVGEPRAGRTRRTADNYQNFAQQLGLGTDNAMSASTYGFNPISVEAIQVTDQLSFFRVHEQLPLFQVIAERSNATHPHTFALGGGDLGANSFSRHLPLELGEGE
jgi:hypothetical protein